MLIVIRRVCLWGLLTLLTCSSEAQQTGSAPAYTVELIIFRTLSPGAAEDWSAPPPGRGFGADSGHGGAAPQLLKVLPADQYKLSGLDARLRTSGAWRPLVHVAWTQTAAAWGGAHLGLTLQDLGINVPDLSGTIYLERGQFLHLGVNLMCGSAPTYVINEMRSVRYNDKQYFDHPAFGVIAMVTPVR
jgi:hypothetical protein